VRERALYLAVARSDAEMVQRLIYKVLGLLGSYFMALVLLEKLHAQANFIAKTWHRFFYIIK
jgi:hypothetical protein